MILIILFFLGVATDSCFASESKEEAPTEIITPPFQLPVPDPNAAEAERPLYYIRSSARDYWRIGRRFCSLEEAISAARAARNVRE